MLTKINYNQIKGSVVNVFDYMTAAQIADTQTGSPTLDVSAAIQAALDTLSPVFFPAGIYGIATGFTVIMNGRSVSGTGRISAAYPTTICGTKFKRISGVVNPLITVANDDGIFEKFAFDNNNAGDYAMVKFTAHGLTVRDLNFYNQGAAGGASMVLSSVNTSSYYDIIAPAIRIEDSLYTNFYNIGVSGGLTGNVLYLDGGFGNGVQNCNFFGLFFENSTDTASVYIEDTVQNVHFYGVRGETASNVAGPLVTINGDRQGSSQYLARNITFDGFVFGINDTTVADGQPFFYVKNALGVSISNVSIRDVTSAAGREYFQLEDVKDFALSNVLDYSGAAHKVIKCIDVGCTAMSATNVHSHSGTTGSMDWAGSFVSVRDTNSAQLFSLATVAVLFEQVSGAMDLTNVTGGITTIECNGTISNVPADGSFGGLTRGVLRLGYATLASATALVLPVYGSIFSVSGTTTITSITGTNAYEGRQITLIFDDVLTFTDGNNLKIAGNFTTSAADTITLVAVGGNFYEIARSAN